VCALREVEHNLKHSFRLGSRGEVLRPAEGPVERARNVRGVFVCEGDTDLLAADPALSLRGGLPQRRRQPGRRLSLTGAALRLCVVGGLAGGSVGTGRVERSVGEMKRRRGSVQAPLSLACFFLRTV